MATTVKSLEERIDEFSADIFGKLDETNIRLDALETTVDFSVRKLTLSLKR